jgi:hypothetical protein
MAGIKESKDLFDYLATSRNIESEIADILFGQRVVMSTKALKLLYFGYVAN